MNIKGKTSIVKNKQQIILHFNVNVYFSLIEFSHTNILNKKKIIFSFLLGPRKRCSLEKFSA